MTLPPLRSYQTAAVRYILKHPRCMLWSDPGTGKTRMVLEALALLALIRDSSKKVLVIAPKAVALDVWPAEAAKWTDLTCEYLPVSNAPDIHAINYERIPEWVEPRKHAWPYDIIVADESTKLKGFRIRQGTKRARALAQVAFCSSRFIALSGTMATNGLTDVWGQCWFIDKGEQLGRTYSAFMNRWFVEEAWSKRILPVNNAEQEIPKRMQSFCMSIRASDWLDMPELIEKDIVVHLPPKARKHYDRMEKEFFTEIEGHEHEAVHAAARSQKLLQLASGAIYTHDMQRRVTGWQAVHDEKLNALADLIDDFREPLVVVYQHKSDMERLLTRFPFAKSIKYRGAQEAWNRGEIRMLLAHPGSAGHGLNLQQGGRALCFFSHTWDLEHVAQVQERIGPARQAQIGRKDPVLIFRIIAKDTLDEAVILRQQGKADVQDCLRQYVESKK